MRNFRIGQLAGCLVPIALAILLQPGVARADNVLVAVASNFVGPLEELARGFEADTGHTLTISAGATGHLFAQIKSGAPFDVFLAADDERPRMLEKDGVGVAGSRFTYAVGQLAVWCPEEPPSGTGNPWQVLKSAKTIAIANPKLAPYGRASRQALEHHGIWKEVEPRVVYGQNIAQVFALVGTRNSQCGIVARSQLMNAGKSLKGGVTVVDSNDHDAIRQDAVLLERANTNPAATAFLSYLKSPPVRKVIASFGYLEVEN